MKPKIPIHNAAFRYRDSAHTNIRLTFARVRREMAEQEKAVAESQREAAVKVRTIKRLA